MKSWPILWDPMDCRTPGLPVHHRLPEFAQIHVHRVGDAIQPSHPLLSPSLPAFNPSHIRVFSSELAVRIRWPKYWRLSIKKRLLRCKTGNWELAYPLFHCHSLHCKWSLWYPLPLQLISTISLLRTFQLFSFLSLFLFSWPVYLIILDFPFTDINQDAFSFL